VWAPESVTWWQREKSHHYPCWELNPGHPAHSLVCILTELHKKIFTHLPD